MVSLQFCAGWTETLLLDNVISAKISCVDSVILFEILGSYLFLHIWENILLKLGK